MILDTETYFHGPKLPPDTEADMRLRLNTAWRARGGSDRYTENKYIEQHAWQTDNDGNLLWVAKIIRHDRPQNLEMG